jgi:hypothetical protein
VANILLTWWQIAINLRAMETVEALISALGGTTIVAGECDVANNTVTYWERRERIPPEHWDALIALAAKRGTKDVDHALMLKLHRPRKPRSDRPQAAA